jgi:hypothetical protein
MSLDKNIIITLDARDGIVMSVYTEMYDLHLAS